MEEADNYPQQFSSEPISKIRDIEEKQRLLKERVVILGENLIETKESLHQKIIEIKKELEIMRKNMERLISFLEMASDEFPKFARKDDLEILKKQAKMFQPLNSARKKK